jgi:hypothetical protein
MGKSGDTHMGLVNRLRGKMSARRAKASGRAHERSVLKADREARAAKSRKQSSPPNIGGGVG